MVKKTVILSIIFINALFVSQSLAIIITVDDDGLADFNTIQAAIDYANDGDEVIIMPGIYTGSKNKNLDFNKKAITVRSLNGPVDCIIDCEKNGRGFIFHSRERRDSVLDGVTIKNGSAGRGGGIYFYNNSSPIIRNCILTNNIAQYGAGLKMERNSDPIIYNCKIIGNKTKARGQGGGIQSNRCSPKIISCEIVNNLARGFGGGIFCWDGNTEIRNCIISRNIAAKGENAWGRGGGIFYIFGNPDIVNSSITDNLAPNGNGGGFCCFECTPILANCVLWGNLALQGDQISVGYPGFTDNSIATVLYCNVQNGEDSVHVQHNSILEWGIGNIDADPSFIDPCNSDYHLLPDSPCIDTGDPNYIAEPDETDLDGNPRVIMGRIDMGAYESNYVEVALKFTPKVLNPKSKGKWLKAHIVLPEYYDVNHLDVNSPAKLYPHSIESDYVYAFVNEEGLVEVEIGFKRSAFCGVEIDNSQTEGIVIGKLTTGEDFYGVGTIEIMDKSLEYVALLSNYWLEPVCSEPDWCDSLDFNHDTVVNFVDYAMMLNECCVEIITDN